MKILTLEHLKAGVIFLIIFILTAIFCSSCSVDSPGAGIQNGVKGIGSSKETTPRIIKCPKI